MRINNLLSFCFAVSFVTWCAAATAPNAGADTPQLTGITAGTWSPNYFTSLQPVDGVDPPQMAVLRKHLARLR